jgi:AraC-like DNA-binding protein
MKYIESLPSLDLRHYIKCFWSLEQSAVEAADSREPVLPDGRVEIIFNLSDRFRKFHTETAFALQPRTLVAGQMTRNIVIGPSGDVKLFGVRFQPTGAFYFLGFPMSELTDRIENYIELSRFDEGHLEDQLLNAADFAHRIAIFEATMLTKLTGAKRFDQRLASAVDALGTMTGNYSVPHLASTFGWSERKLERDFKKFVGVSPKMFSRIRRFSSIVHSLETSGPSELIDHAHQFGYYDQSHMINDFRGFAGESPTAFYRRSHRLSELFTVGG